MALLANTNAYMGDLKGKDKLAKLIQYGARFFKFYLMDLTPGFSDQLELLEKNFSGARKVFRLGKFLPELEKANKAWGKLKTNTLEAIVALIGRYSLALWFLGDHMVWLAKLKVFPTSVTPHEKYFKQRSWQFRTIGYACCIILEYFSVNKRQKQRVKSFDEGEERKLAVQKHERNMLHYFMMCLVGLKNGFLFNSIHDGYTGLFGSISALCVCYDVFLSKCNK